ncbi:MAG: hypothetical protein ABJE95_16755 [Byssovorax sp.]
MPRAWSPLIATTLVAALALSAAVASAEPGPPSAGAPPADSAAPVADVCEPAVATWAKDASQHTGLTISAAACPTGLIRLQVAGAGCDFEVARGRGFQKTADGKFGVSPIANLDWAVAPEPMKKALAAVLAALAQDPSLAIRDGDPIRHAPGSGPGMGSQRNQIIAGSAGGALLVAAGVGFWLMKRRRAKPAATPASAPTEPAPEAPPAPEPPEPPAA